MDKKQQRELAKAKRGEIEKGYREKAELAVAACIAALDEIRQARVVMCYKALGTELSIKSLEQELGKEGKCLCYPVSGEDGIMKAYAPWDEGSWRKGKFGIVEPDPDRSRLIDPADIDVVLCPALAFDENKMRLGYGKGYYDRFLPLCTKALRIVPAFEAQRFEMLATDEYDQEMHLVVTEKGMF